MSKGAPKNISSVTFSMESQLSPIKVKDYLVVATEARGVLGAPFQIMVLPQTMARAAFQPYTATGKLKAEMMPITPSGFQHSSKAWPKEKIDANVSNLVA